MSTFETLPNGHNLAGTGCRPLRAQLTFKYIDDNDSTPQNNNNNNNITNNNSIIEENIDYNNDRDRDSECSFDNDNNNNNYPYEVVETVLNIQPDDQDDSTTTTATDFRSKMMSRSPSLSESISEGYCTSYTDTNNSLTCSRLGSELDHNDFSRLYQCVPRTAFHRFSMDQNKNNDVLYDFRRFSEPQIFQKFYNKSSSLSNVKSIIEQNPQEVQAPLRRVATIDGRPQEQMYHTTFNDVDMNLDCPCSKHHHRRNSVAIRFNKALYKKV
ncbi:hypothetical protein C6P45_005290 [Maudiozyma exigua]|uniref:Uncharacterized protein n=1 Tax=Maudiozyma exigua TaxID=34358 RepID=A0A9P6WEV2_MAUEX|nr:hypothetical protein C6P45_005290 [Kazachstania exigua]